MCVRQQQRMPGACARARAGLLRGAGLTRNPRPAGAGPRKAKKNAPSSRWALGAMCISADARCPGGRIGAAPEQQSTERACMHEGNRQHVNSPGRAGVAGSTTVGRATASMWGRAVNDKCGAGPAAWEHNGKCGVACNCTKVALRASPRRQQPQTIPPTPERAPRPHFHRTTQSLST